MGEGCVPRCGDIVARHELLGEILRGFQLRSTFGGAKNFQPGCLEGIHNTRSQRRFRPDNGEMDFLVLRKLDEAWYIAQGNIHQPIFMRRARITGRNVDALHTRVLREPPGERVFAAA